MNSIFREGDGIRLFWHFATYLVDFFFVYRKTFYIFEENNIISNQKAIMLFVNLPDNTVRKLPFYLAMEEYLARSYNDEFFFMWQVHPTVIFGRNQLIDSEVNINYCRNHGIEMYRRKSGGGCVYADMDNIMFSYIVSSENVTTTFKEYTSRVAEILRSLGLDASSTGRNDVMIGDKKVSGNAFYHIPGRSIVHGTMLYDTDLEKMINSISPSSAKLESKGVSSVRNHITTIREHSDIGIEEFKTYVREHLCDSELNLTEKDVDAIEELACPYFSEEWIFGKNPRCSVHHRMRIEGVGEFVVDLLLHNGVIKDMNLTGDFFLVGDLSTQLIALLKGVSYSEESLKRAIEEIEVEDVIVGMTKENLLTLLINNGKYQKDLSA